jgi:hypothetical protein
VEPTIVITQLYQNKWVVEPKRCLGELYQENKFNNITKQMMSMFPRGNMTAGSCGHLRGG